MAMSRPKYYLVRWLKGKFTAIDAATLGFTNDFKVEYVGEDASSVQLKIHDPLLGMRYFTIKVTEHH